MKKIFFLLVILSSLTLAQTNQAYAKYHQIVEGSVALDSAAVSATDTITFTGAVWGKVRVQGLTSTDSIAVGMGLTIPSTLLKILPGEVLITGQMYKSKFSKLFIKAFGAANSTKYYRVFIESF